MAGTANECMKDTRKSHNQVGPDARPDDCIALMRQISLRLEDAVDNFPQRDEEIVQES